MIRVSDLVLTRGPLKILDGVNLDVRQGEVTALVGPSGGGKSTLLRCINGLEQFAAGTVAVGDDLKLAGGKNHDTKALLALRRRVGMVFQSFNLFPHMTAVENVMSGPVYALGQSKTEARATAEKLLARVGLAEKAGAKPATLSGGQQQRVAIARALAVNPKAMLFDEPTSALDPKMAGEVLAVIRDLAREGQTMVIISHDIRAMQEIANRICILERGKVLFDESVDRAFGDDGPATKLLG